MTAQILEFSKQGVSVENNYTKIPNWLFDADIEAVERVVLMTIARYTIGYHRRSAKIPMSVLCKAAKCSKPRMIKAINALDSKFIGVLRATVNGAKSSNEYQLIRNFDDDINSDVVNPVYHPSKPSLPPLVNPVYHPSKPSLHNKENFKESNKENFKEKDSAQTENQNAAQQPDCSTASQSELASKAKSSNCKTKGKQEKQARAESVVTLYHDALPELPRVAKLTDKRISAINSRFSEDLPTLADWQAYFAQVANSAFLTGKSGKFKADLEWLVNPNNFVKVAEGKYNQSFATTAPQRPQPTEPMQPSWTRKSRYFQEMVDALNNEQGE